MEVDKCSRCSEEKKRIHHINGKIYCGRCGKILNN